MSGELIIVTAPDTGDEWELRARSWSVDDGEVDGLIVDEFLTHQVAPVTLAVSGDHGFIGAWRWDGDDAWRASECPTCESTDPADHIATGPRSDVEPCPDAWHSLPMGRNDVAQVARLRTALAGAYPGRAGWWTR